MATINDVAKEAGVSIATVSRSFTNGDVLNPETRRRVMEAANRLNYQPRRTASANQFEPQLSQAMSIGFQFVAVNEHDSLLGNDFYGQVLAGAQEEADALNMHILLHTTQKNKLSQGLPPMIGQRAIGGMLLAGSDDMGMLKTFEQFVPTIVLVDYCDKSSTYDCLYSDGFGGAFEAVTYLIKLGHRRIGFLSSAMKAVSFDDRLYGYVCALHAAGIAADPGLNCVAGESEDPANMCVSLADITQFLMRPDRPTAIFAVNDAHALALLHACRRIGVSVPGDLSVIGFDDVDFSAHTFPPLTSVRVDKHQLGRASVRRLNERMRSSTDTAISNEPRIRIEMPATLIVRESAAGPRT